MAALKTAACLITGALWRELEPLLPAPKPRRARYPGRRPQERRAALEGILFVLRTGIGWNAAAQGTRLWLRQCLPPPPGGVE